MSLRDALKFPHIRPAKVATEQTTIPIDCSVVSINENEAAIVVPDPDFIPEQFTLILAES